MRVLLICALLALAAPLTSALLLPVAGARAQDHDGASRDAPRGLSTRTTDGLIRQIDRDLYTCYKLGDLYYYDCYRKTFRRAASTLRGNRDYEAAYTAMKLCETRVGRAVDANLAPDLPRKRAGFVSYVAIRPDASARLRQTTLDVVEEAKTVLLRAPSAGQKPHFQKIAQALDSTKVLLRAAARSWITWWQQLA
ncbi:hypothetical protein MHM88_15365 [Epibacterium sp. MM17-32]|uniref:hypothetical protein n=1 Tax=Epibacterium sp. MM17-32 TaxID=2917734 RepID=UPI001EF47DFD|nr:hypothetical protein [Epibacterium sp. MM17-32]MCG7629188.1 hypothetical protein [Epibacterium sp. MM17-32]